MKCIILAAGLGTRMGPITKTVPKSMVEINGKPKLAWTFDLLPEKVDEVILVAGYLKEQVIDFFGDEYGGKKIKYLEQKELDGTARGVALARDLIKEKERFLVIMGDDLYLKKDLEKLAELEDSWGLLAYETGEAENFGLLEIDNDGALKNILERPHGKKKGLVNTGAYLLDSNYFKADEVRISEKEFGLPQTMLKYSLENNIIIKIIKTKKWFAIGDQKAYQKSNDVLGGFLEK